MVQQPARRPVGRVHRAQESPGLGQQLSDRGGLHGREELTSMDAAEVRQVSEEVDTLGHDRKARHLSVCCVSVGGRAVVAITK